MIRMRLGDMALLGLTDVNVKRLTEGKPISLRLADLTHGLDWVQLEHRPGGQVSEGPPEHIVLFYASRNALVEIAEARGIDPKVLLDRIGEG